MIQGLRGVEVKVHNLVMEEILKIITIISRIKLNNHIKTMEVPRTTLTTTMLQTTTQTIVLTNTIKIGTTKTTMVNSMLKMAKKTKKINNEEPQITIKAKTRNRMDKNKHIRITMGVTQAISRIKTVRINLAISKLIKLKDKNKII